ncbi:acyl-CoA thioesterase [Spirochaeta africana]|uniref:Putative thioesterase n=1 Tax=Spirochaeta africana (strain ATCC 700263 / DSM 8902 / Z-7692) TaxID=889378 RepID=H9UM56_SPIAZ|nr:thioesterase family protein [Spirochaeta africana]AFG38599.1 putative thioesterase [Spirochaeta africana DSM 8902]
MDTSQFPPYTVPVHMRFRDLDAYGHVNNAVMFNYLEEARISLLGQRFYAADAQQDIQFLVRKASCEYLRPLLLTGPEVLITMRISEMRGASFLLDYAIHDNEGTEYARAETLMVCFDPVRNRPARIPAWFLEHLAQNTGG